MCGEYVYVNPLTYIELISCEDTIADDIDMKIKLDKAQKAIHTELSKREKEILIMRYGIENNKPKTQKEVSSVLGISRSYVSRIEKQALNKIQVHLTKDLPSEEKNLVAEVSESPKISIALKESKVLK